MHHQLDDFVRGYAHLLGTSVDSFFEAGMTFASTPIRDLPEWANWIQPVWLFAFEDAVICSVSPAYTEAAKANLADLRAEVLLSDATLARAKSVASQLEWVRCELFYYSHAEAPQINDHYYVEKLRPGQPESERHLRNFDGGVYVIWSPQGEITAAAFVKNKGLIREIAVGTEEMYRRQGRGSAVVAHAIREIMAQGCVATYWPDSLENKASYAVAEQVGMVKVAKMLFCAYELPEWEGFEDF